MKRTYTFFCFNTNLDSSSKELIYLYKSHVIKSFDKNIDLTYFLSLLKENEKKMYKIGKNSLQFINPLSKEKTFIWFKEGKLHIKTNNPHSFLFEIIKRIKYHYIFE